MTISKQSGLYRIKRREATANRLYGAIDLGSNTFRLLIGEVFDHGLKPLVKLMHTVRLGEGLSRTGRINDQAMSSALEALKDFKAAIDRHQPQAVRVCGTAALRTATNRDLFLTQANKVLGVEIEIIDGEQEANLSGSGALSTIKTMPACPVLLADVGGGSSELILSADSNWEITKSISLPLGAVHLSETYLLAALPQANELSAMSGHIEEALAESVAALTKLPKTVVGIGGAATALAALDCNLTEYNSEAIQDYVLSKGKLELLLNKLAKLTAAERNQLPGMAGGRGEIIIGGLMIFIALLKLLPFTHLSVSDGGLPEGILLSIACKDEKMDKTLR